MDKFVSARGQRVAVSCVHGLGVYGFVVYMVILVRKSMTFIPLLRNRLYVYEQINDQKSAIL
jgi:hypothetical protein